MSNETENDDSIIAITVSDDGGSTGVAVFPKGMAHFANLHKADCITISMLDGEPLIQLYGEGKWKMLEDVSHGNVASIPTGPRKQPQ
jgi:hypothetical protein